jgi:phosphoheptose isomerase
LLIAISSSGNSANIVGAVERARARGMRTIGFSGFSGGRLREACDIPIHVAADNYGIVEDAHQAIMHVIAQFTAIGRDRSARPVAVA